MKNGLGHPVNETVYCLCQSYWYLMGPYQITVGKPMYFSGDADDRAQVEAASLQLMDQIAYLAEESRLRLSRLVPSPVVSR